MLVPGIEHIEQPYWFGSDRSMSPEDFGLQAARALERKIEEVGADKVAAFVGEPIQGAGGVIIPPETYWPEIQRICNEHGILLVTDEVICGFGRLGEWFGADYYGVSPDLMTFAKGVTSGYLPLGGVMVGDRVSEVLIDKGGEFYHGFTYSGHPASCAVSDREHSHPAAGKPGRVYEERHRSLPAGEVVDVAGTSARWRNTHGWPDGRVRNRQGQGVA